MTFPNASLCLNQKPRTPTYTPMNEETVAEKGPPVLVLCFFIAIVTAVYISPNLSEETFWVFAETLRQLLAVMTISCIGAFIASLSDMWRQC